MVPDQWRQRSQVSRGELADPLGLRQHLLKHKRVDIDHAVLQQVQRQHADLVILASIAHQLAPAGEKDEVVGAVPLLDHVEPFD